MRLHKDQIETLKKTILSLDSNAEIVLFGSRTDDKKKGGDIDILIVSCKLNRKDIWKIRDKFFDDFGEQKLDIIIDDGTFSDPFKQKVYAEGIQL